MKVDILFLGRLFPREKEAEIKSKMKTGMQDAANALQWNIIDGLEANDCGKIRILTHCQRECKMVMSLCRTFDRFSKL